MAATVSLLPLVKDQHWYFRIWDFGRIQLFFIHLALLIGIWFFIPRYSTQFILTAGITFALVIYHAWVLFPYTRLYPRKVKKATEGGKTPVSIVSCNVYQFNSKYHLLLKTIAETDPDLVITMESNKAWENALKPLENSYAHYVKVPQENTYGMHLYSKLPLRKKVVHQLISHDIPCIEVDVETPDGDLIRIFCLHPPPPSPTEEATSKERDGELMVAAKKVKESKVPVAVVGDFNNVAWSRSSKLFKRNSQLIDPRIGHGFVSTFHAKYRFLRFPIDLFFHSPEVVMMEFHTLGQVGSDHLPLYAKFKLDEKEKAIQEDEIEESEIGDEEETEEFIDEGERTLGYRPAIATEG